MKKIIWLIILIILTVLGYYFYKDYNGFIEEKKKENILDKIEKESVVITKWSIYGTSLNIGGNLNLNINTNLIENIKLVFHGEKNKEFDINYNINNNSINFNINDKINKGIYLDDIEVDKYIILLKIKLKTEENNIKLYTLNNETKYSDAEYYTLTKNNKNNIIKVYFDKKGKINYMKIDVNQVELPENVYDFSIDPGHGGDDSGAFVNKTNESDVVLEYGKMLKKELEKLGFKVFISRNNSKSKNMGVFESYNKDGRVNIIQKSKAKYNLSIHLNSANVKMQKGGVEIYIPNNIDYSFASSIVDNIIESANTTYSPNMAFRIDKGIYYRYFDEEALEKSKKDAAKYNYKLYEIDNNTPYMYIVRELGGINTNAYVDGRNKRYGKNLYYNNNIGIESYLLELGFMVNDNDFNNLINNKESYVRGIIKAFEKKFKNL